MSRAQPHKDVPKSTPKQLEQARERYRRNKEKRKAQVLARYYENREARLEQQAKYREENREDCNARTRDWSRRNKAKVDANCAAYRARKRQQTKDPLETNHVFQCCREICRWLEILTDTKWHVDHIKPLSRGGLHHYSNFQLLPQIANLRKSNRV